MLNQQELEKIRQFNRQYTNKLGIMNKNIFETGLKWSEARLLLEIYLNHLKTPKDLVNQLKLDKSYVSRTVNSLVKKQMLNKVQSKSDLRAVNLALTEKGISVSKRLNNESNEQIISMLSNLSEQERNSFYNSISNINSTLFKE
ncbi:MarR family winged helix-turn-helix transcriptional regulator [Apilactobacillus ozensis]|uniref:MarR family winged helix-turn-helix transcriptional regulator n=1 Tax=Apilactobacillus ozensis TaxID=866801 RepID=UPI00200A9F0C|nr:MarR family winged helix-turn-helix transcriptional regulator [Apilactobacillus ozensis]MCK8607164.1 MarR family winged helix-turn-helix transcriptional regulator [Apilactobacillus ozensis]